MSTIKTYMCNKKIPSLLVSKRDRQAVVVSERLVMAKLQPVGCHIARKAIRAEIMPESAWGDFAQCLGGGYLQWERRASAVSLGNVHLETLITVSLSHPLLPCHWRRTRLYSIRTGPSEQQDLQITHASVNTGMIPPDRQGAYPGSAGKVTQLRNAQTPYVPGSLLQVEWLFLFNGMYFSDVAAGSWFYTPLVTGGEVTAVSGTGEDRLVTVAFHGTAAALTPTDFADYQPGDWVYLMSNDGPARTCARTSGFAGGDMGLPASFDPDTSQQSLMGEIEARVNVIRAEHGIPSLIGASALTSAAAAHSVDMSSGHGVDHTGSDGSSPFDRAVNAGYVDAEDPDVGVGENLAAGYETAGSVVAAWMNSPGHRANILNESWTETGIGILRGVDGYLYFTQLFGFRGSIPEEAGPATPVTDLRVVPMKVNNVGGESGGMETRDYNMMSGHAFARFFEISRHTGVVTSVDANQNTVDIEISEGEGGLSGTFQNVPVFYHCEGEANTDLGIRAFYEDAAVIVLNEGGGCSPTANDLVVVGFDAGLMPCVNAVLRVRLGAEVLLLDMRTMKPVHWIDEIGDPIEYPLTVQEANNILVGELSMSSRSKTNASAIAYEHQWSHEYEQSLAAPFPNPYECESGTGIWAYEGGEEATIEWPGGSFSVVASGYGTSSHYALREWVEGEFGHLFCHTVESWNEQEESSAAQNIRHNVYNLQGRAFYYHYQQTHELYRHYTNAVETYYFTRTRTMSYEGLFEPYNMVITLSDWEGASGPHHQVNPPNEYWLGNSPPYAHFNAPSNMSLKTNPVTAIFWKQHAAILEQPYIRNDDTGYGLPEAGDGSHWGFAQLYINSEGEHDFTDLHAVNMEIDVFPYFTKTLVEHFTENYSLFTNGLQIDLYTQD